ncbi:hypothetical protein JCM19992_18550 [Thermostilla marina]
MLAVLAVVAVLVWGPRLMPSFGEDAQTDVAGAGVTVLSPESGSRRTEEPLSWDRLVAWNRSDPAGWAGDDFPLLHDPFVPPQAMAAEDGTHAEAGGALHVVSPADVNLEVTAVLLRRAGGMAVISGRFVELGQEIRVEADGKVGVFTLAEVHADHVVLESGGRRFSVALPGEKTQDDIEVVRAVPENE